MAKFVTEDGMGSISGDAFMMQMQRGGDSFTLNSIIRPYEKHTEIQKLKIPGGRTNSYRLLNMNIYDLLIHIQESLSWKDSCVIELITNEKHKCLHKDENIRRKINEYAELRMGDDFISIYPRKEICIRDNETGEITYRMETDEELHDRICRKYMEIYNPSELRKIECGGCLQKWLNDDKW